ncbi:MAG: hypothetical protein ACT4PK_01170 [Gammaproteobacteria bacterium]
MTILRLIAAALVLVSLSADARDDRLRFSVKEAMAKDETKAKLDGSVRFYWGKNAPEGAKMLGTFTANKKTNFFNKSDEEGCYWSWLSAMVALQERARKEGGNAVVNIKSIYRKQELVSATEFECGAGNVTGGVSLRGTVAKVR